MGHDRQDSSTAVIAVVLIGLLFLFIVVGGALVLLGGLFFMRSSEPMMVEDISIAAEYPEPVTVAPIAPITKTIIHVDAMGQSTIDGELLSIDELKARLGEHVEQNDLSAVQLHVAADCSAEKLAEVISACEQATGATPQFTLDADDRAIAPDSPIPNAIGD